MRFGFGLGTATRKAGVGSIVPPSNPSVFDGGTIRAYTGATANDAGDLLGTGNLPARAFENTVDGARAKRGVWSLNATKNGTIRSLLLSSADDSINVFLPVTEAAGGGLVIIDNDDVEIGDVVAIATLVWITTTASIWDEGTIAFYTGSAANDAGDLLAVGSLPTRAFADPVSGVRAQSGTWEATATKNGTVRGALLTSGDGTQHKWCTVTEAAGGGDIIIDNDDVEINDVIALATMEWTLPVAPADGLYFMSDEVPGPTTRLIDNFRRGNWATQNGDHADWQHVAPGWRMDLSAGDPQAGTPFVPANAVRNLQAIGKKPPFATSDYVASTGIVPRGGAYPNSRNQASHNLKDADAGGHNEIFVRLPVFFVPANYYGAGNPAVGYLFGGQKFLTINRWNDDGGIYWGGVGINIGGTESGVAEPNGILGMVNNHSNTPVPGGEKRVQNQGNDITLVAGHWYIIQTRFKLNTHGNADGVWELWVNDGGPTGDFSGQVPTLRARYLNVDFGYTNAEPQKMGSIWLEDWSNPVSSGEQFWGDSVRVDTTGPIPLVP